MNFTRRLASAWSALLADDVPTDLVARAPSRPLREAAGVAIDDDEDQWRRLTGDAQRDLSPLTRERMQEIAVYLWRGTPLGKQLIELAVAYLLGEGVTIGCKNEQAAKWLDLFWRDPINLMELKLEKKMRELAIFGEQCWPAFVNEHNGHVRLGYLDPALIAAVVTDPDNIEQPIGVVTKRDRKGETKRYRIIVNGDEDVFSKRAQAIRATLDTGDCFYFAVNALSTAPRGQSDLLALADWLDLYENQLYSDAERFKEMRAFFWDVTLTGATKEDVAERAKTIAAPKPASVRVHNDAEQWAAVAPKLNSGESAEASRLFRNHILGGAAFPEHWFGGGGDVNRATAGEMGEPTFKTLTRRQRLWKTILEIVGGYVIRQRAAKENVAIDGDAADDLQVIVNFPELTARDTTKYAGALQQVVVAASAAIGQGLLSEETATVLIASVAGQLGVEIDAEKELAAARDQKSKRAEADVFQEPAPDRADDPAKEG